MLPELFFEKLREQAKTFSEEGGSHEFSHTERVYNMSLIIAKSEKEIDLDILKTAVLLHYIAREKEDKGECECHAKEGAKMAKEILLKTEFPKEKIDKVTYVINIHRHSSGIKPETKEAEILQDADRLDALGAITIGRMFATGGKVGRPLHIPNIKSQKINGYSNTTINGFYDKILKITPNTFYTKKAQEIAVGRYKFVEEFVDRFLKEWDEKE